jgi:hypothetical protein
MMKQLDVGKFKNHALEKRKSCLRKYVAFGKMHHQNNAENWRFEKGKEDGNIMKKSTIEESKSSYSVV